MDEELKKALAELSTKIDDLKKDNTRRHNLIRFESLGLASGTLTLATLGLWFVKNNGAYVIAMIVFLVIAIATLSYARRFEEKK